MATPIERTRELAGLDYSLLAERLKAYPIALPNTQVRIGLTDTQGFPRSENNRGVYKPVLEMDPLEIYTCYVQGKLITLVASLDQGQIGACIKLNRGLRLSANNQTERIPRASDITQILRLDKGNAGRLAFLNETNTLYVVNNTFLPAEPTKTVPFKPAPSEIAHRVIDGIVGQ